MHFLVSVRKSGENTLVYLTFSLQTESQILNSQNKMDPEAVAIDHSATWSADDEARLRRLERDIQ